MANKAPTRKQLSQTLIETYLQLCGLTEMMRQMAMAEMFKNYEKDFTKKQREVWRAFELGEPFGRRSYAND